MSLRGAPGHVHPGSVVPRPIDGKLHVTSAAGHSTNPPRSTRAVTCVS